MLALQLLPTNSCGGIVVITDGVINVPDINTLDTLLSHLRTKTISLSFIQVQSRPGCQNTREWGIRFPERSGLNHNLADQFRGNKKFKVFLE